MIRVEIDGDALVEWFKDRESTAVILTGVTYLVTAPIEDVLDGAIENMRIVFEEDDGD